MYDKLPEKAVPTANFGPSEINNTTATTDAAKNLTLYDVLIPFFGVVIVSINLSVLVSGAVRFLHVRKRNMTDCRCTYMFLMNMASANFLTGAAVVFGQLYPVRTQIVCLIQTGLIVLSTLVVLYTANLIALDRSLYVLLRAEKYRTWLTPINGGLLISLTWLIGLVPGCLIFYANFTGPQCWFIFVPPHYLVNVVISIGFVSILIDGVIVMIVIVSCLVQRAKRCSDTIRTAVKLTVYTVFSVSTTWLPYLITCHVYVSNCDSDNDNDVLSLSNTKYCQSMALILASPLVLLGLTNCFLQPIIYVWWGRARARALSTNLFQKVVHRTTVRTIFTN